MAAPRARQRFCGQARRAATFLLVAALAAQLSSPCAAHTGSNLLRRLLQTGTGASTASQAAGTGGTAAANNDFVGAAQQTLSSANAQQAGSVAAKQLVSSSTGNLPINSNDLNTLIQGVRATQTFGQYLATLGGEASRQTSLQSTLQGQNIAGLYKQQTTDERFKVGSPSGSVYWTAGNEPVPAPAQAVAANFANALAPGVNSLTQSLMELIPSPPPPPPPPTVIQALAPLEQAATQRIADILTTSGQAASANSGAGAGAARTARDGTSSFQQQPAAAAQDALPTVAVPTTFTHDTWNAENYGRKLQQVQWQPTQQQQAAASSQQNWAPASNAAQNQQQQAVSPSQLWAPSTQTQQTAPASQQKWDNSASNSNNWAPSANGQQWAPTNQAAASNWSPQPQQWSPQPQQQWAPSNQAQQQQGTGTQQNWGNSASAATNNNWSPQPQQQWSPQPQQQWSPQQQQQWSPQPQQWSPQQQWAPQAAAPTQATSAAMTIDGNPITPQVQLADGTWVPSPQQQQQTTTTSTDKTAAVANTNTQGADATRSQVTGTGQPSQYGASSANQGTTNAATTTATTNNGAEQSTSASAPSPSSSALTFPPVTINGVNLPGWSLPTWSPAPPLGPAPALAPLPLAPQPQPLPGQAQPAVSASFQDLTNQGVPLTQSLAQQSALPQLQAIGGGPAVRPNNNLPAQPAGPAQPGLPGFPAPAGPAAIPNNNLVWVGLGGSGKQGSNT